MVKQHYFFEVIKDYPVVFASLFPLSLESPLPEGLIY